MVVQSSVILGISCPRFPSEKGLSRYVRSLEQAGGLSWPLKPGNNANPIRLAKELNGLLLPGGLDIHPSRYGGKIDPAAGLMWDEERDDFEFSLIQAALSRELPILAICRGMQVLNVALGGSLIRDIPGHRAVRGKSSFHTIAVHSGSRLAGVLGSAQSMVVNSRHHQGVGAAEKAPSLAASAHRPQDGILEGLESPNHSWVIGVQCHPEREDEVPESFKNLFTAFVEAASRTFRG